jgi:hypothetical protein
MGQEVKENKLMNKERRRMINEEMKMEDARGRTDRSKMRLPSTHQVYEVLF